MHRLRRAYVHALSTSAVVVVGGMVASIIRRCRSGSVGEHTGLACDGADAMALRCPPRPNQPRSESPPACSHRFTVVHVDGYCVGGFNQDFLGRHGMDRSTYQSLDQTAARVVISNRFCQQRDRGLEYRDVTARSAKMACEALGRGHREFLSGTALCRGCFHFGWIRRKILISFPNQTYECYQFPRPP